MTKSVPAPEPVGNEVQSQPEPQAVPEKGKSKRMWLLFICDDVAYVEGKDGSSQIPVPTGNWHVQATDFTTGQTFSLKPVLTAQGAARQLLPAPAGFVSIEALKDWTSRNWTAIQSQPTTVLKLDTNPTLRQEWDKQFKFMSTTAWVEIK